MLRAPGHYTLKSGHYTTVNILYVNFETLKIFGDLIKKPIKNDNVQHFHKNIVLSLKIPQVSRSVRGPIERVTYYR